MTGTRLDRGTETGGPRRTGRSAPLAVDARASAPPGRSIVALLAWFSPSIAFGAIAGYRWSQFGGFVAGLDVANWLAVGRGYADRGGKPAGSTYPPLVPVLLQFGQGVTDAMTAAKVVGIGSLLAIMVATYAVARQAMNRWIGVAIASAVGLAGILTEQLVLGRYPQQYALAFLVVGAFALSNYLANGRLRLLVGASACLAGAALSHHMYFAVACLVYALIWAIWLSTPPTRPLFIRRTIGSLAAGLAASACFLPTLLAFRAGYDPAIQNTSTSWEAALRYGIRESPWLWVPVFVAGSTFLALTGRRRRGATWQVAVALIVVSLVLFSVTTQARLLPLLTVGSTLGAGLALHDFWWRHQRSAWGGLPLAAATVVPLLLLLTPRAVSTASALHQSDRVLDQSLVNAAAFVEAHAEGRTVAVRQDRRALPVGWWFEGLTGAAIAVGSDESALAFPAERDNARLVDRFFAQELSSAAAARLGAETGVGLLVFGKWEWLGWVRWLAEPAPAVSVEYDDGRFMIVDLHPDPLTRPASDSSTAIAVGPSDG